jgi:very-short-patch-repair endonuclease
VGRVWSVFGDIRLKATTQHGLLTRAQLLQAGLTSEQIRRWAETGRLIRVHQGVYALGHLPPSPHAKTMAALLACGPHAVLSHRSAAQLWGLMRYHGPIEVTAPTKRSRPGVIVHRDRLEETDVTCHWGLPTTTAARTLEDIARVLTRDSLTRAVNTARLNGHLSLDDLPPRLRADQAPRPTRSGFEDAFLRFVRRHRLPMPEVNAIVAGYEVDMLWRPQLLVAELDGHQHDAQFESDREKDADLLAHGVRVIRVTYERFTERPGKEAARFRALLA